MTATSDSSCDESLRSDSLASATRLRPLADVGCAMLCALAALWATAGIAADPSSGTAPSVDIPHLARADAVRPITLQDIVSIREISEPTLSPDGTRVAYLVKQAFQSCNCTRTAIYLSSMSNPGSARKIDEESRISSLTWTPDGRRLSFLSARDGTIQLWWIGLEGGLPQRVFRHAANADMAIFPNAQLRADVPVAVADYAWSPDGRLVAFSTVAPVDMGGRRRAELAGVRYDDARMSIMDVNAGQWLSAKRSAQLWVYDTRDHRERLLWHTPPGTWAHIATMAWSPAGDRLALSFPYGVDEQSRTAAIIDVRTGRFRKLLDARGIIGAMAWAPDGHAIAIISRTVGDSMDAQLTVSRPGTSKVLEIVHHLTPEATPSLFWIGDRVYFGSDGIGLRREDGGLYAVVSSGGRPKRITALADKVADCSRPVGYRVACVWQAPTRAPRAAVVDLTTGALRQLSDVNPELKSVQLGMVEELHWVNEFGGSTNGYLVLPAGTRAAGVRLPLVVMGYGFDGDFVAQANWFLTSYPAQAFARDGIAVLLINPPKWEAWSGNDFVRGARAWGYGPLASLKAILERLGKSGIIDPGRVGFMGHSWAGFWVQFTASHSHLLRAAELQNGGTITEPGSYSDTGRDSVRIAQDHFMGGGPYPPTLRNYLDFSATLTAGRVGLPVLMEYDAREAPFALEYFTALRVHRVPVDLIIYPDDGHVFTMPAHRLISMRRNVEWFEFWLLGKERDDPGAAGRYARWTGMRKELDAIESRAAGAAARRTR